MRAGQTVVVLGACHDSAQFEPFVWPEMCVLRTPLGLVTEQECAARSVSCTRLLRAARDRVASAYVLDARGRESQPDADAVASWLAVVESATRTPCTLCFARGAIPLTAVPLFVARRRLDVLRVRGPGVRASARVALDDGEGHDRAAARILHAEGALPAPTLGALRDAYLYVKRSKHVFELRPRQPCTLCGAVIPHGPARYMVCACLTSANPLPTAHICGSCPTADFSVLGYRFGLAAGPSGRQTLAPLLAPCTSRGVDTLWSARARIGLAVARAVFRSHREAEPRDAPEAGALSPFARAMLSALRDMKLCRLVVERLAFSPLSLCATPRQASRSLSVLISM
jgi:hypothetical protein